MKKKKNNFFWWVLAIIFLASLTVFIQKQKGKEDQNLKTHNDFMDSVKALPPTVIQFENNHFDFGKIKEGAAITHNFIFKNTGEFPLIIADVIPSCGCTIPKFSSLPIQSGDTGHIQVTFNSSGQKGKVRKNIIVISNAHREQFQINLTGEVMP